MKSDLLDLDVAVHARTDAGVKVSIDGEGKNAKWLPLRFVEIEHKHRNVHTITLPEWLAVEKGLV